MSDRTFKLQDKPIKGDDVKAWEQELKELFKGIGIDAPIVPNGVYADIDRSYTKSFVHAIGLNVDDVLDQGVTPEVRTFLRHWREHLDPAQQHVMDARKDWRRRLRDRYGKIRDHGQGDVSLFIKKLLADSWGYHPGIHDGIDLISLPDVPIYAPVKCKVVDVRSEGWWNLGAPKDPILRAKGDGIVQLEILETVGPFKKGYHIGLGHAEKARVREGQVVEAGHWVANTGFANAWHIHDMLNDGTVGTRGIGNRDPKPCVDYSIKHAND
jgi:murein DD-endopeptidase MepM/ murein hydrolase activator NlpD